MSTTVSKPVSQPVGFASLKLGKTPARKDAVTFKLTAYLDTAALPAPPATCTKHDKLVTQPWSMLGNDHWGDCVFAGAAHETMLWNAEASSTVTFTDQSVLSDYSAVTHFDPNDPSSDRGTDMQAAASYRRKTGVVDADGRRHQVAAYLAITPSDETQLKQAVHLFSNAGVGIEFPGSAMDQFRAGKPWTVVDGAKIEGGHYVPAIGYNRHWVYVVTWGKLQKMSWEFYAKYCDEALCYLSTEMLTDGKSPEGLDVAALQADLAQLG